MTFDPNSPHHSIVYEVRAERSDGRVLGFGVLATRPEAETRLDSQRARNTDGELHRWWVETIDPATIWTVPTTPTPRQRYRCRAIDLTPPGRSTRYRAEVWRGDEMVASYDRNAAMGKDLFEPFRQGDRDLALVSVDYTATAVLDLQTGQIIAAEEPDPDGFCPVGFYVPDWWDLHDGHNLIPGTLAWSPVDHEWPTGDFGFVWGCVWGDDHSWKVQYLDLSRVQQGEIRRDERFGVVHLNTTSDRGGRDVIKCTSFGGERKVLFFTESYFELTTGDLLDPSAW